MAVDEPVDQSMPLLIQSPREAPAQFCRIIPEQSLPQSQAADSLEELHFPPRVPVQTLRLRPPASQTDSLTPRDYIDAQRAAVAAAPAPVAAAPAPDASSDIVSVRSQDVAKSRAGSEGADKKKARRSAAEQTLDQAKDLLNSAKEWDFEFHEASSMRDREFRTFLARLGNIGRKTAVLPAEWTTAADLAWAAGTTNVI